MSSQDSHFDIIHRVEKHNGLRCMYTNTDQLQNKLFELETFCAEHKIDLVAITETLPKQNVPDKDCIKFNLNGYQTLQNNSGRGVCIFYKDSLTVNEIPHDFNSFPCSIFCNIKTNTNEKLTLGLVYRSPNSSAEDNIKLINYLNSFLPKLKSGNDKLLLMGDFNLRDIDWEQESCSKDDHDVNTKFLKCVHKHYLTQFVSKYTHHRAEQSPTLIDLILSNDQEFVHDVKHSVPLGMSHHDVISFTININQTNVSLPPITKDLLEKGDYPGIINFFKSTDWDTIFKKDPIDQSVVDEQLEDFENVLNTAKERFVPTRTIYRKSIHYKKKFPTPQSLIELFHHKRKAYKYYKQYPSHANYEVYSLLRKQVKQAVRLSKRTQEQTIAKKSKDNPKLLYQYIASMSKPKEPVSNLTKEDGTLTENDLEKAKVLNNFFYSVFLHEDNQNIPEFKSKVKSSVDTVNITTEDMYKCLKSLKVSKSPGPDNVHPRILKEAAEVLAYPLKLLFDSTIKAGKIPTKWKTAEVRPIFKKGAKSDPGNYRPVSLTSVICKVFETFIRDTLCSHLINNDLLSTDQFGFCKGRSCVTQLLSTLYDWFAFLDQNIPVDAIYLDFRKAFDTVPHKRLLSKLSGYGVKSNLLSWIEDFLSNRTQYVSINGQCSESVPVSSGVPQGSVLGPSLFIYYINDLPSVCEALAKIFADDTKSYNGIRTLDDCCKLQRTLNALQEWSAKWLMGFNTGKCGVMHLGKNNPKYDYVMKEGGEDKILTKTTCEKDLGVFIDKNLNFKEHIIKEVKRARQTAGIIHRNITNKTPDIMVPLFKSMVRPIVEYANPVWAPYLKQDIKCIENVQKHFTKKIYGMRKKNYHERLRFLKLPSLEYRRLRGDMIEVYKILHGIYDPKTTDKLLTRMPENSITRKANNLNLVKKRSNQNPFQNFFTNRINNTWNALPNDVVNAMNVNSFKNKIDAYFRNYIYKTDLSSE